jgi:sulfite reductase beta subunit-like hemoprotein
LVLNCVVGDELMIEDERGRERSQATGHAKTYDHDHGSTFPITARANMQVRHGQVKATEHILAHVERAKESLRNIRAGNLSVEGVFIHPASQQAALKVAREELDKAIAVMERTRWTR